jgi:hypothetical protein
LPKRPSNIALLFVWLFTSKTPRPPAWGFLLAKFETALARWQLHTAAMTRYRYQLSVEVADTPNEPHWHAVLQPTTEHTDTAPAQAPAPITLEFGSALELVAHLEGLGWQPHPPNGLR